MKKKCLLILETHEDPKNSRENNRKDILVVLRFVIGTFVVRVVNLGRKSREEYYMR